MASASWLNGWLTGDVVTAAEFRKGAGCVYDTTVAGSVASSIDTLAVLPTTYAHMLVIIYGRGDTAATAANVLMRFNNDGAANYQSQTITTTNTTVTAAESLAASSLYVGGMPANTATGNYFSAQRILIPHYANAVNHKAIEVTAGFRTVATTTGGNSAQSVGWWGSTSAINRIQIFPAAGNFAIGTRMSVYVMGS